MNGKQAAEGLTRTTEGPEGGITEAIEGLRVKFEKIRIVEGPSLRVNMVDLNQPPPEMEDVERGLKLEREQIIFGYPKANKTL